MGRRFGGGSSSVLSTNLLVLRLQQCKCGYGTVDEIVDYLRSNYPEYRRVKLQPFFSIVRDTLSQQQHKKPNRSNKYGPSPSRTPDDYDEVGTRPSRKRRKKVDPSEERLLRIERQHRIRRSSSYEDNSSASSSSAEESGEADGEGTVSTSEDVVYGQKVEPEFDLMKSMLRESQGKQSTAEKSKDEEDENILELELVGNPKKSVEIVEGCARRGSNLQNSKLNGSGMDVLMAERRDGPKFKDLGGMRSVIDELIMEVIVPLCHPELPKWLGVMPMSGILLHGPPGCGKSKLAHAIANETGVSFYKISATEVVSSVSGASEENIRELFSKAYRTAPSIVFIDEIDAIASKRENLQREMGRRIVTQLMTCMEESHKLVQPATSDPDAKGVDKKPGYVLVIGATNRPDAVDPALRRPGRFDREIVLGVPDENARAEILSVLVRDLRVEGSFDLAKIARWTSGFVGADLKALANKAGNLAMKRIIDGRKSEVSRQSLEEEHTDEWWKQSWLPEEMEQLSIKMTDFEEAVKLVQPSLRREGFSSIPNVKWGDVGGLGNLRQEFDRYIVRRIRYPEDYEEFGVDLQTGFLLYGPPGCGKTLIAKAVANEAGANFIHIKGPELLNKYVGESELAVRTIFSRARSCSPCILFFDEVDALTTKRGTEGGWVVERLLNQLLIELDGAEQRRGVFVIGATNRPEVMDRAFLRPGRFGKLLYVPLPTPEGRGLILQALGRKKPIGAEVDLMAIGRTCENLSGADLAALMNEAAMAALEDKQRSGGSGTKDATARTIGATHFEQALGKISPSISHNQILHYHILSESFEAA